VGAGLDLRKLGMFGFSLGGYASANTMLADERVTAGIDLDGTLQDDPVKGPLGEVARTGLDRPFLLFGSGDTQRTDPRVEHYDASWASVWAQDEYIAAFFDQTLRRRPSLLLRGDSPKFREIRFAR
jgi:hypothetical protein